MDESSLDRIIDEHISPNLSNQERVLMALLVEKGRVSYDEISDKMFAEFARTPEDEKNHVRQLISNIRKKVSEPVRVKNIRGFGYLLLGVPEVDIQKEPYPIKEPITPLERKILKELMEGKPKSYKTLIQAMYGWGRPPNSSHNILSVMICRIRSKLKENWKIRTIIGFGYELVKRTPL